MLILISIALLAALFHNLTEVNTLKKQLEAAGKSFSWREHAQRNYISWIATLLPVVILSLSHQHLLGTFPLLGKWMFIVYLVVGWGGSDLAIVFFSSSQKRLTEVITENVK